MDNSLDDLASFGSDGILSSEDKKLHNSMLPPASPPRFRASPIYNPMGLTIGQISPGVKSFNSNQSSSGGRNESNSYVNAVHMHVQENAKIPNYNKAVDRRIPSTQQNNNNHPLPPLATTTPQAQDDPNQFLNDFSMAELFLNKESSSRKSLAQNYENLGSIKPSLINATTPNADATAMEIEALTAAIDPTPWSEIEDKMHQEAAARQQQMHPPAPNNNHPHQSSYYPYGRHHQLPIPERVRSPQKQKETVPITRADATAIHKDGMADAIATAAAIAARTAAATAAASESPDKRRFPQSSIAANPAPIAPAPNAAATANYSAANAPNAAPPLKIQRQRANSVTPPTHAAAHSTSRASLVTAASRRSQYGFGGNHAVPSVPAPPPTHGPRPKVVSTTTTVRSTTAPAPAFPKNIAARPTSVKAQNSYKNLGTINGNKAKNTMPSRTGVPPPRQPVPIAPLPPSLTSGNGAAYERKKQRAKDARIKLNESIDRLSIAISLAGSQASERISQLQESTVTTNCRQHTLDSNEECFKIADSAKKWDRPSFVGSAASLIQALNGQCEALMAEVGELQQRLGGEDTKPAHINNSSPSSTHASVVTEPNDGANASNDLAMESSLPDGTMDGQTASSQKVGVIDAGSKPQHSKESSPPLSGLKRIDESSNLDESEPASKRTRLNDGSAAESDAGDSNEELSDDAIIFKGVAKFLDPLSLCRSIRVCQLWKDLPGFIDDDVWLQLLMKRFGFYNVRQWSQKYEEGDEGSTKQISNKNLYKEMNAANVMPHLSNQDGTVSLLGEATIPGKASGWVFLVERSNGETLRSVKQQPGSKGSSRAYQSRPVVELRMIVQNTGMTNRPMILKKQAVNVDVSTRRTGGELVEIDWDNRFLKVVKNIDGTSWRPRAENQGELCSLDLFDSIVLEFHVLATGCSTTSKFRQRSNFTKILVSLDGTTVPMVIPFPREHNSSIH